MNNDLKIFENEEFGKIRSVMVNNEPYFVGKDICMIFGDTNHKRSLARLDEDEKVIVPVKTNGGIQNMIVINESGLYSLLFNMQPEKAKGVSQNDPRIEERTKMLKDFKKWVTHEVLPSIRKHGSYMTEQKIEEIILNPDTVIKLAQELKAEKEEKKKLAEKIEFDKPKVIFANSVVASENSILIRELAKLLKQNHIDIGQNRLYDYLRDNGYIIKGSTEPTQKAMNLKLFEVEESTYYVRNLPKISFTTRVTPKGQIYFINKLTKERDYVRG